MKKGLTYAALAALSVSAVIAAPAPQASAAGTAQQGIYDNAANKYYSFTDFGRLAKAQKKALLTKNDVVLVYKERVLTLTDVVTVTNAKLPTAGRTIADYEAESGKDLGGIANPGIDDVDYKQLVLGTWNTSYSGYSIKATFNKDMTSDINAGGINTKGAYSIDGSEMTMTIPILGKTVTGEITKVSDNEFTITSGDTVLKFTK